MRVKVNWQVRNVPDVTIVGQRLKKRNRTLDARLRREHRQPVNGVSPDHGVRVLQEFNQDTNCALATFIMKRRAIGTVRCVADSRDLLEPIQQ